MRLINHLLLCCTLLCFVGTAAALQVEQAAVPVQVAVHGEDPQPGLGTLQSGCVSLSQAVQQVRRQYNGQIVSAETVVRGNRETHIIKVLTSDGTVKTVRVAGCNRN
ncbi:MAG: PepSY domain-containing protein [Woeseiaceae bacterium]